MKAAVIAALAAGLALAAWLVFGRNDTTPTGPTAPQTQQQAAPRGPALPAAIADAPAGAPVVMWVAQAKARFEPCGCVAGMHGGLMRRAVLTERLPRARVLSLELGGWSGGSRAHERIRSRFYLRGLAAAGVDAVAIGADEAGLGRDRLGELQAAAAEAGVALVCANLDQPGLAPAQRVTAGGRNFTVTAVLPPGPGVRDPVEALTAVVAAAGGDAVVAMADLEPDAAKALAAAVPQLALVVAGRSEHPSPAPLAVGSVRVLWAGNHGKVLGSWAVGENAAAFELLADSLPEDPAQRALLGQYQRALAEANLDGVAAGGMRPLGAAGYAGSAACIACHQDAAAVHAKSRHADAFNALVKKGYQHDPDCLRCHVTGLGEGGYVRGAQAFAEVGCESCHGPGSAHIAAIAAGRPDQGRLPDLSAASCVGCHDAENSPRFDYPTYWPKIRH